MLQLGKVQLRRVPVLSYSTLYMSNGGMAYVGTNFENNITVEVLNEHQAARITTKPLYLSDSKGGLSVHRIVYVRMGFIDSLEISPGQIAFSCSQRDFSS